jgi:hypothetical protein
MYVSRSSSVTFLVSSFYFSFSSLICLRVAILETSQTTVLLVLGRGNVSVEGPKSCSGTIFRRGKISTGKVHVLKACLVEYNVGIVRGGLCIQSFFGEPAVRTSLLMGRGMYSEVFVEVREVGGVFVVFRR